MTCREFDEAVHGFVRMELLDMVAREEALEHAARCGNCAERMAGAGVLAEATDGVAKSVREQQAPASVEAALLTAFRGHVRRAAWRRTFEWATVGAAAAMLLVFLWTFTARSREQSLPSPKKDVSSQSKAPLNAAAPVVSQPDQAGGTDDVEAVVGETFAGEDFVPLPSADAIGPEDLGMIVHVQLTQASLTELGYPVVDIPDPDEDLISADVLVGEDGWPRAVRVVQ